MSAVPPGVSAYNWLRQQQLRSVATTAGLQLTQLKASDPSGICGRQIDSSVAVGGVGNIPIQTDTITPDLIQGHAFVAPTYVDAQDHGNLLLNPAAQFGLTSWTSLNGAGPSIFSFNSASEWFSIISNGGTAIDSVLYQTVTGLIPGQTYTVSGNIEVDAMGVNENAIAGVDILTSIGLIGEYYVRSVQPMTAFQLTFTMPSGTDGNVQIRCHNGSGVGTSPMAAYYQKLKLELGSIATPFNLASFDAIAEVDVAGVLHSVIASVGFTNIPMNATKILWCYRNTNSTSWIPWAESTIPGLPYPPQFQVLSFGYGQIALGVNYDFGAAYVDLQGNTGAISAFATNYSPAANEFLINSSYMKTFGGTFTPSFLSTPALHSVLSANGISSAVTMDFTIDNQPVDGSLSRVSLWYRVTPSGGSGTPASSAPYTFYASVPAAGVGLPIGSLPSSGTYSFTFTDLTNGSSYDFAVSCEDSSGGETALVYGNTLTPQQLVLPTSSVTLPSAPPNTYVNASATSVQVGQNGQSSFYAQLSLTIVVTDGPGGAPISPSPWLAQIRILSKPIASSSGGDHDLNANDFTICNTIYTDTISQPIVIVVGPFPANMNQELAVQLIDQAGNGSNSNTFEIATPPGPVFDENGNLEYISYGIPIKQVITPVGTLQNGTVGRAQMATPAAGQNLIFNPTGFFGTQYWIEAGTNGLTPYFANDQYNGGRFRLQSSPGQSFDFVEYQTFSNLVPGTNFVASGLIEIDSLGNNTCLGGIDCYDPIGQTLLGSYYAGPSSVNTGPQPFSFSFAVPASGAVQFRMHINGTGSNASADMYVYKPQLEYGTVATPFNDASASNAAANTHTPAGQIVITGGSGGTVSSGQMAFDATPTSVQTVINNDTNTYNAGFPTAGSTVPYYNINNAYQIATGPGGQIQNAVFLSSTLQTGTTAVAFYPIVVPQGGTYQFFISVTAFTSNARGELTTYQPYNGNVLPAGYTNNQNMFTTGPLITGANPITGSFICNGGQTIGVSYIISSSSGLTQPGIMTVTGYKIT